MKLLESRMNGNVHVRFGGGLTEKCQASYRRLVTRWLPTLRQLEQQQRVSGGGVPRSSGSAGNVPWCPLRDRGKGGRPCLPEERRGLFLTGGGSSVPPGEYRIAPPLVVGSRARGQSPGRGTHPMLVIKMKTSSSQWPGCGPRPGRPPVPGLRALVSGASHAAGNL
jgi:hypothetical protein